jgi:hypothetical protein
MVATLAPHNLGYSNGLEYYRNIHFSWGFCLMYINSQQLIAANSEIFELGI